MKYLVFFWFYFYFNHLNLSFAWSFTPDISIDQLKDNPIDSHVSIDESACLPSIPLPKPDGSSSIIEDDAFIDLTFSLKSFLDQHRHMFNVEEKSSSRPSFSSFALLGQQNVGKSSVLEYLGSTPCGFSRQNLGTTRPIIYHFKKDSSQSKIKLAIHTPNNIISHKELKKTLEQSQVEITSIPINIYVTWINAYTVTVVDLPGLTADDQTKKVSNKEKPITIKATDIRELLLDFLTDPHRLIVVVRMGEWVDDNSMKVEKLAREVDPAGYRTIVLTTRMWTMMRSVTPAYFQENEHFKNSPKFFFDLALSEDGSALVPFPHIPSEVKEMKSLARKKLIALLETNSEGNKIISLFNDVIGIEKVNIYVRSLFVRSPLIELPWIAKTLRNLINELKEESLGIKENHPFLNDKKKQVHAIQDSIQIFAESFSEFLQSTAGYLDNPGLTIDEERKKIHNVANELNPKMHTHTSKNDEWKFFPWLNFNFSSTRTQVIGWPSVEDVTWENASLYGGRAYVRFMNEMELAFNKIELKFDSPDEVLYFQGVSYSNTESFSPNIAVGAAKAICEKAFSPLFRYGIQRSFVILLHSFTPKKNRSEMSAIIWKLMNKRCKGLYPLHEVSHYWRVFLYDAFRSYLRDVIYPETMFLYNFFSQSKSTHFFLSSKSADYSDVPLLEINEYIVDLTNDLISNAKNNFYQDLKDVIDIIVKRGILAEDGSGSKRFAIFLRKIIRQEQRDNEDFFLNSTFGSINKKPQTQLNEIEDLLEQLTPLQQSCGDRKSVV